LTVTVMPDTAPDDGRPSRGTVVMLRHQNRKIFMFLAALGILLLVVEIAQSYLPQHKIGGIRLIVECVIAFFGFYGLDPTDIHAAGDLAFKYGSGILTVMRGGRSTDAPGTTVQTTVIPPEDADSEPKPPTR
jgi:hypothetical protein